MIERIENFDLCFRILENLAGLEVDVYETKIIIVL